MGRFGVDAWGVDLNLGVVGGQVVGRLTLYGDFGGGVCFMHLKPIVVGDL